MSTYSIPLFRLIHELQRFLLAFLCSFCDDLCFWKALIVLLQLVVVLDEQMKGIVSISPNESIIYAKVEKRCGNNVDNLGLPMLMSCRHLIRIKDR